MDINKKHFYNYLPLGEEKQVPAFMSFLLPPEFDPSENYSFRKCYAYDELDNNRFNKYLKLLENFPKYKKMKEDINEPFRQVDKKTFYTKNHTLIFKIFQNIMDKSTITSKHDYEIKGFFLESVLCANSCSVWLIESVICLHKNGCAYGKAANISFIYSKDSDEIQISICNLKGIILEQNISSINGLYYDQK